MDDWLVFLGGNCLHILFKSISIYFNIHIIYILIMYIYGFALFGHPLTQW